MDRLEELVSDYVQAQRYSCDRAALRTRCRHRFRGPSSHRTSSAPAHRWQNIQYNRQLPPRGDRDRFECSRPESVSALSASEGPASNSPTCRVGFRESPTPSSITYRRATDPQSGHPRKPEISVTTVGPQTFDAGAPFKPFELQERGAPPSALRGSEN